jgi:HTH-type transcriptional regulator/antitoxin HigA
MKSSELIPIEATHPGQLIKDEIAFLGISQKEAASRMDVTASIVSGLIAGKLHVTPTLALKLESVFQIDAEYWLRLQIKYELDSLRIRYKKAFERKHVPKQLSSTMLDFISRNIAL